MTFYVTNIEATKKPPARAISKRAWSGIYRDFAKPILEFFAILLFMPIVVPLIALMAIAVASDGYNPFYSQLRVGKGGRRFRMWKLRTMVPDADEILEHHLSSCPKARAEWNETQKLKIDPRITRVGRVLRKTSMDELPQLVNVLTGSMSLVGPRPMMPCQQADYFGQAYYNLRPGITGPWQVLDRNATAFSARVNHDETYDREISLLTDVKLLAKTVGVVLRGTGY